MSQESSQHTACIGNSCLEEHRVLRRVLLLHRQVESVCSHPAAIALSCLALQERAPLSQVMLQPPNPEGAAGDKVNVPSQDKLSINVMYHATSNRMTSEAAPGGFEAMDLPARASRQLRAKNRIWELEGRGLEHKRVALGSSIGAKLQMHGALPRQLAKSLLHLDTFHGEPLLNVLGSTEDAHRGVRRTTIFAVPPPLSPQRTRPRAAWQLLPAEG
eukprot:CAMPEP_0203999898 /NCGR_PEP_ID=MMETSP0360-20130528/14928_1 /ASSEMBLY_ACC=CAM_ASM_000342 /TAXON_ID=268821 /ORGANISM="Scrippsiella Hangoei, Strain SHTV-5" /LENGTH=215 /DNA_ID=CAMNT_0050941095 /DNA_START=34 /DNA_END=679 /DNA_ORIENTATION=-